MIHPTQHFNIDRSSVTVKRASGEQKSLPRSAGPSLNTDDAYIGVRIANGVALLIGAVLLAASCVWFFHTFLEAVPAISRVVTGGK